MSKQRRNRLNGLRCSNKTKPSWSRPGVYSGRRNKRLLSFENLESRHLLAVVIVDTTADVVDPADGVTSLREAIIQTGQLPGHDTIDFAPSLTSGGPATIVLTNGELLIRSSVTIDGPGADLLTISAIGNDPTPQLKNGDGSRIFNIDDGLSGAIQVSIDGLTLTGASTRRLNILRGAPFDLLRVLRSPTWSSRPTPPLKEALFVWLMA